MKKKPETSTKAAEKELARAIKEINAVVEAHSNTTSALRGLVTVAAAFGALLDVYALPNPNNPLGMCDDPIAFRAHFCEIIQTVPGKGARA